MRLFFAVDPIPQIALGVTFSPFDRALVAPSSLSDGLLAGHLGAPLGTVDIPAITIAADQYLPTAARTKIKAG